MEQQQSSKVLKISDAACTRIKEILAAEQNTAQAIRIKIGTRGCSGLSYEVEYANDKKQFDEIVIQDGVQVYIDPAAVMFLIGATMDYQDDRLSSGFVFINPNETGRCGCGESFSVDPKAS